VVIGKKPNQYEVELLRQAVVAVTYETKAKISAQIGRKKIVLEKLLAQIDFSSIIKASLSVSPNHRRVAYVAQAGKKLFVVVDGKEGKLYDGIGEPGPIFSPDSQRVAYGAKVGDKWFVVVDGEEMEPYDSLESLTFSPDSQQVAYGAKAGDKWFAVVDGKQQKPYDLIVRAGEAKIIFDCFGNLHYIAQKGNDVYLVEGGIE
jgi:hypothetical protein